MARNCAMQAKARIGIAGWAIPKDHQTTLGGSGTHLERYSRRFNAVEINSSFYRPHRRSTFERWAGSVPTEFRFSAKVPKIISHTLRLRACSRELGDFLGAVAGLGHKLEVLLVQLPPSLEFDAAIAAEFFTLIRRESPANIVCEPRHASWFAPSVDALLRDLSIGRAAADPPIVDAAAQASGGCGLVYYRLHGSPRMYYSPYSSRYLNSLHEQLQTHAASGSSVWCIFDNTADHAAWNNALELQQIERDAPARRRDGYFAVRA
jgi:uncharacterized protein YecE (DUF72 family)